MINNNIDFAPLRAHLARHGRVQVREFLQADAAARLRQCLQHEVPWTLAEHIDGKPSTVSAATYAALDDAGRQTRLNAAYARARQGFQYVYDSYPMVEAAKEGRDPGLLLHVVLGFLNSPQFIAFARWLGGVDGINLVSAQATRYRHGHFLTRHDDEEPSEGRVFAYVINLTPRWVADWGGLLQFVDEHGDVAETFSPCWNSLSLFRVPQAHAVSLVSPWAQEDRLAITGWWLQR